MKRPAKRLLLAASVPILTLLVLPVISLLVRVPPEAVVAEGADPLAVQAVQLTLVTSLLSTAVIALFGSPLAVLLAHGRSKVSRLAETLLDLPVLLPPAVSGVALLMAFGREGVLGGTLQALGIALPFSTAAVVVAQTFVSTPFFVKSFANSLRGIEPSLTEAAQSCGASRWNTFWRISLPLAWPGFVTGLALGPIDILDCTDCDRAV